MTRREFSRAQKAQMLKRASDEIGNIFCEGCGLNITGKVVEFDHTIAEALIIDKTRPLTVEDGRALGAKRGRRVVYDALEAIGYKPSFAVAVGRYWRGERKKLKAERRP
mgnify:CR=1 FL=1